MSYDFQIFRYRKIYFEDMYLNGIGEVDMYIKKDIIVIGSSWDVIRCRISSDACHQYADNTNNETVRDHFIAYSIKRMKNHSLNLFIYRNHLVDFLSRMTHCDRQDNHTKIKDLYQLMRLR